MKLSPLARKVAAGILVTATAAFLLRTVLANWQEIRGFEWQLRLPLLVASVPAHVAVLVLGVWIWGRVLRRFDTPAIDLRVLLRIWFGSALARYVPGAIWQFVAAAQLSRAASLSPALLLTSMLVHVGFSLLAASVTAAWTIPAASGADWRIGALVGVGAVLLTHPVVVRMAVSTVARVARRPAVQWNGSWLDGLELLALSVASWLCYGAAFFLLVGALVPTSGDLWLRLAGVNALSFLAGYLVVIAPAGLGIREVSMVMLLSPILPAGIASLVAVASRLWTIAAEIVGGILSLFAARHSQ